MNGYDLAECLPGILQFSPQAVNALFFWKELVAVFIEKRVHAAEQAGAFCYRQEQIFFAWTDFDLRVCAKERCAS